MRIYVGFDDTDSLGADRGTGKLARFFEEELPTGCRLWGVVRQQLLLHADVPYTSHNSSACAVVDVKNGSAMEHITERAIAHIRRTWPGQDIKIGAQVYLKRFYGSFGFSPVSDEYLEDDIPHIDMILKT